MRCLVNEQVWLTRAWIRTFKGWINDENPREAAVRIAKTHNFQVSSALECWHTDMGWGTGSLT